MYKGRITFFYILSIIMFILGVYKLFFYSNPEYGSSINAYVGGDAYNYIINVGYTCAFFILGIGFLVIATIYTCAQDKLKKIEGLQDVVMINNSNPPSDLDELPDL